MGAEPGLAQRQRIGGDQLAVEPGCRLAGDQGLERLRREDGDRHGPRSLLGRRVSLDPREMVRADVPAAVAIARGVAGAAQRLEPAHVRARELLARRRVLAQVQVDRVAPAVGSGDPRDRAVDLANTAALRLDPHHRVLGQRLERITPAHGHIVDPAIGRVDQEIMAILQLIGEAALDPAPDQRTRIGRAGLVDRLLGKRPLRPACGQRALHRADDVAALAHPLERRCHVFLETPQPVPHLLRQPHPRQRREAADPQALLERV